MKKNTITSEVFTAIWLAGGAALLWPALLFLFGPYLSLRVLLLLAGGVYLLHLTNSAPLRMGRSVISLVIAAAALLLLALSAGPTAIIISLCFSIWLLRTLLYHRRGSSIIADGLLCCASPFLSLALTGYSSNLALTIWIFLLLQALWVLLPQAEGCRGRRAEACAAMPPEERFTAALRSAQGALERLRCVSG